MYHSYDCIQEPLPSLTPQTEGQFQGFAPTTSNLGNQATQELLPPPSLP